MTTRGRRRRWAAVALVLVVAAAGSVLVGRRGPKVTDPQPFTPSTPSVEALREAAAGANVVICVIDAARADHVGCYGYPRETTPNIDRLAGESLVFREHFTQYALTKCATASLFTGQHADTHLAYGNRPLREDAFTLAKGLAGAGLATVMFSSNPNAAPATGLGLDFEEVHDQREVEPLVKSWEQFTDPGALLSLIEPWIEKHRRKPFFAYIHFDPPHQPYLQPQEMTQLFEGKQPPGLERGPYEFPVGDREALKTTGHPPLPEWANLYDANLRYGDWAVGELLRILREEGLYDNTILIVTSDHGEAFGEHGYIWHERGVYDELVHIPLVVHLPGTVEPREIGSLTQTIDLLPTVCDLLEVPYPRGEVQGASLLPLMAGGTGDPHDFVISRSDGKPPSYLVRSRDWSLILWGNGEWRSLHELRADPGQRRNVIAQEPETAEVLVSEFARFAETQRRPPREFLDPEAEEIPLPEEGGVKLSAEEERRLRALGYVK